MAEGTPTRAAAEEQEESGGGENAGGCRVGISRLRERDNHRCRRYLLASHLPLY